MIRINKLTDYAVVLMVHMVRTGVQKSVHQCAVETHIPTPTVAKIMKALSKNKLVVAARGSRGGYLLGRAPEDISVADIVCVIEGPIALTSCVDEAVDLCGIRSFCPMHGHWNRVNAAVQGALSSVTLADMAMDHVSHVSCESHVIQAQY